jgi:hypothetical protein
VARQADLDAVRDLIEEIQEHQNTDYWRVHVVPQRELWEQGRRLPSSSVDELSPEGPDSDSNEGVQERQAALEEERGSQGAAQYQGGKWGQYVRAPDIWFDFLESAGPLLVPFHELATISRGFTSGADRFYCVRDVTEEQLSRTLGPAEFRRTWGIARKDTAKVRVVRDGEGGLHLVEARFLEPEFHTLMEAKSVVIHTADVKRVVINAPVTRASLRCKRRSNNVPQRR